MIMAFENGLTLLRTQYDRDNNGYSLYLDNNTSNIYYVCYNINC